MRQARVHEQKSRKHINRYWNTYLQAKPVAPWCQGPQMRRETFSMANQNTARKQSRNAGPVTILEAEPVDVEAVGALDARITGLSKPDYWRKAYTRYGTRPDRFFLVAERDGK